MTRHDALFFKISPDQSLLAVIIVHCIVFHQNNIVGILEIECYLGISTGIFSKKPKLKYFLAQGII